ncbi:HGGxSTG domain-containing protein [Shewanella sp. SP1S2-4]|uniref:HGGxSTG domain-containing protein n=1 Tax=Shewanella sp. SP1S2-4 TaxID=3063537 RepID=UPI00288E54BA|nr:HGGxSTG domain-containing protein [Shewanella sp. SP1S2-4]MDT3320235.1 HGGxSTG domain-containing protein [Shewanella sp. SP1S2-4]
MSRFNLETLPRCGAKTRSGNPCQRYGNKTNGRCKLHGGRSTGAKTKEGKLAVRVNALLNPFMWHFNKRFNLEIKQAYIANALSAYLRLIELTKLQTRGLDEITEIVSQYRFELETTKYYIAEFDGSEALLIIQSALDHYYKDTAAEHLKFHIYSAVYPTPYFNSSHGSIAELKNEMRIFAKAERKKGFGYVGRIPVDPIHKALKRQLKKSKAAHQI